MAAGEPTRALAREFKVGEATLRRNFSAQAPVIQDVAQRLAAAELDLAHLPVTAQQSARTLADQLKSVQDHYAKTAELGADTAHRLAGIANRQAQKLKDDVVADDLRTIAALSDTANRALNPASNLIAANKPKEQERPGGLEALLDGTWGEK
jgi:hypothetical protein